MTTEWYLGCDLSSDPVVGGSTSISSFQQAIIPEVDVTFESSSEELAVTGARLTMNFKPISLLPQNGIISLQVPAWYIVSEEQQPFEYSSESMLSFDSDAKFESHASEGFEIRSSNFDQASRSLIMNYSGTRAIRNDETVSIGVSDFKNPVNKKPKTGFRISVQDSQGYLVDQT